MARRILLTTAMMESPRLIIADEPTPGLHLEAAKKAMRHFRDFADQGNGVLLITHDIEERIIDGLGIERDWLQRFPGELSGGEMKRFCIARAWGNGQSFSLLTKLALCSI